MNYNDKLIKIDDVDFADGLFDAHITNTPLDNLFSISGGVPKATNWMIVGDPGVGKCVHPKTLVTIKIDSTGEILTLPIEDIHGLIKK